jgi:hypothetical protein
LQEHDALARKHGAPVRQLVPEVGDGLAQTDAGGEFAARKELSSRFLKGVCASPVFDLAAISSEAIACITATSWNE